MTNDYEVDETPSDEILTDEICWDCGDPYTVSSYDSPESVYCCAGVDPDFENNLWVAQEYGDEGMLERALSAIADEERKAGQRARWAAERERVGQSHARPAQTRTYNGPNNEAWQSTEPDDDGDF